jgi:hypothetical protein
MTGGYYSAPADPPEDRQAKAEAPEPDVDGEEFVAWLLSPKPGNSELIRRLHGTEER